MISKNTGRASKKCLYICCETSTSFIKSLKEKDFQRYHNALVRYQEMGKIPEAIALRKKLRGEQAFIASE